MKILLICDGLFRGGLAKVVLAWADGLSARGHTVGLALLNPQKDYPLPPLAWQTEFTKQAPKSGLRRWRHRAKWTAFIRKSIAGFERQQGAADLRLHGAQRQPRVVGDLLVRQATEEGQRDQLARLRTSDWLPS